MKLHLRVTTQGKDPYEVTTNLKVIVAWERRFKRKASEMASGIGVEDLAFMAWEASKTAKIVVPAEFDKFIDQLDNVEVIVQELENPTPGEPTADF
jgi:hypothetical protein